ncbi:MAG TPA: UDP-N-acetylglucosamine--N-acetylmuramyl-(pentapeptide) pyrophosphoryl-undecaprenol N-acetylglucosamine transferase [Gemmatimonadota bacterium]|nr:UDP-N-acetylglucosamine--N-acetylmuramyl-(pentapeptide) pyrophosphoryl-undecaprenol N-acetylglucosamine transferase [Gemmatimonadota bacterium]
MGARVLIAGGGTGGHLYPALNLADALRRADPSTELLYLGATRGLEASVLPGRGLPYRLLPMQPVHRSRPWRNWRLAATAPAVAWGTAAAFRSFRPDLVLGTGGYAAAPALAWGILTGRSTALQEQNARPGRVTRLFAPRVDQLHLGFPEAERTLSPGTRTEVFAIGNPVAVAGRAAGARYDWPEGRVILVAGGSQGARGINERLLGDLASARTWPEGTSLVWIAGRDHAEEVRRRVATLPGRARIRVEPFIEDLGAQLGRVSLAIARAGAMFVSELAAWGVPAVLVPFPGAADAHQSANAAVLRAAGAAVVREERDLTPGELWSLAAGIVADEPRRGRMSRAARERGAPDAADRIARELLRLAEGGGAPAAAAPGRRGSPDPGSGHEG